MASYIMHPAATTMVLRFIGINNDFHYKWIFMPAEVGGDKALQFQKAF